MTKEDFELLPDNEKRVAIAKDVIVQLENQKIIARTGAYFESFSINMDLTNSNEYEMSLQELLLKKRNDCHVCAMGALFLSDIMLRNEFMVSRDNIDDIGTGIISAKLTYFSKDQLKLIEAAFERAIYAYPEIKRFTMYETAFERMVAIMENIIANDGEFIP